MTSLLAYPSPNTTDYSNPTTSENNHKPRKTFPNSCVSPISFGGALRRVLADWCPPFDGFCLCYSGRRNISSAFRLVIDRLRYDPARD